jgi:hypothetical protein
MRDYVHCSLILGLFSLHLFSFCILCYFTFAVDIVGRVMIDIGSDKYRPDGYRDHH